MGLREELIEWEIGSKIFLSLEKKFYTIFLSPKVSCLYFNPNLLA